MSSNNNNNTNHSKSNGFKLNSKILLNKFFSNSNCNNAANSGINLSDSSIINNNNNSNNMSSLNSQHSSTLNVITSAAAAAVNSIHNMITSSSLTNNTNGSSSSSTSSAQHTPTSPHNFDDFNGVNNSHPIGNNLNHKSSNNTGGSFAVITKVEKKHFDKINKLADKLMKLCQSEKMNLINSPPYIIDILPDICQVYNTIYVVYENKLHLLNDLEYFTILLKNCMDKFQQLIDLFKVAGKRMYEETSEERQKLVKYTLIYSHILAEMKSIFPKDVYEGQAYRIAKKDAEDFWKSNFNDRVIVSWREFEFKLNRVHKISNKNEAELIRETIQLTKSKYVSIFEFDIFTRLFQPWNNLLNNWKFLVTEHPAYSAFSTYDEVHKRLQKHIAKPGSYLFRLSCTKLGQWAIGYVTTDRKILQTIPQSLVQALIDGQNQGLYVYPDGRDIKIDISSAIAVTSASRIQISKEQYEQYCDVGLSFQVCKICAENNKDRKLEPCGHLICSTCLDNWQEQHTVPSCPFCRCEIKSFEPILISPFENSLNVNTKSLTNGSLNGNNEASAPIKSSSTSTSTIGSSEDSCAASYLKPNNENKSNQQPPTCSIIQFSSVTNKEKSSLNADDMLTNLEDDINDVYLKPNKSDAQLTLTKNSKNLESKYNLENLIKHDVTIGVAASNAGEVKGQLVLASHDLNQDDAHLISNKRRSSHMSALPVPTLPPPPPPPPSLTTLPSKLTENMNHTSVIVSGDCGKNSIQLKIENDILFEQFISKHLGSSITNCNDKLRAACALILANNDCQIAKEILIVSNKLES